MNRLAPAMAAGIVPFDPDAIAFASETHDSLAALFFAPERAKRIRCCAAACVVCDGELTVPDVRPLPERQRALSRAHLCD